VPISGFTLEPVFALVGIILCIIGWVLMLIGALVKGV
jgi:hypothetical protein